MVRPLNRFGPRRKSPHQIAWVIVCNPIACAVLLLRNPKRSVRGNTAVPETGTLDVKASVRLFDSC